jgi:hypothetical protein
MGVGLLFSHLSSLLIMSTHSKAAHVSSLSRVFKAVEPSCSIRLCVLLFASHSRRERTEERERDGKKDEKRETNEPFYPFSPSLAVMATAALAVVPAERQEEHQHQLSPAEVHRARMQQAFKLAYEAFDAGEVPIGKTFFSDSSLLELALQLTA